MSCHYPETHHRLGRTERIVVIMDLKGIPSALLNRDFFISAIKSRNEESDLHGKHLYGLLGRLDDCEDVYGRENKRCEKSLFL